MNYTPALYILIVALYSLMVFRAFRSGTAADYVLGAAQCTGLLLLLGDLRVYGLYCLLFTAAAYLLSQIVTGARPVSRLLPLAGAAVVLILLLR